jgi:hypothetical protein
MLIRNRLGRKKQGNGEGNNVEDGREGLDNTNRSSKLLTIAT